MFQPHIAPFTALQRIANWRAYFLPRQHQSPITSITRQQPSIRESLLRSAKSLRQSAEFYQERLKTFKNTPEDEVCFRLDAERCENAARQIENALRMPCAGSRYDADSGTCKSGRTRNGKAHSG